MESARRAVFVEDPQQLQATELCHCWSIPITHEQHAGPRAERALSGETIFGARPSPI